jgi:hypothetical protein
MTFAAASATQVESPPRMVVEDHWAPEAIERLMGEIEPYLRRAAKRIAIHYPAAVADMIQEARITLWELELGRSTSADAAQLDRILRNRMIEAYRTEWYGGLTASNWQRVIWCPLAEEPRRRLHKRRNDRSCRMNQLAAR